LGLAQLLAGDVVHRLDRFVASTADALDWAKSENQNQNRSNSQKFVIMQMRIYLLLDV